MKNKFDFYEIVRVNSDDLSHASLNGKLGVVRGMAEDERAEVWIYGVSLYDEGGLVQRFFEEQIESTGKMAGRDEFVTEDSVRVTTNPDSGEGKIKGG